MLRTCQNIFSGIKLNKHVSSEKQIYIAKRGKTPTEKWKMLEREKMQEILEASKQTST